MVVIFLLVRDLVPGLLLFFQLGHWPQKSCSHRGIPRKDPHEEVVAFRKKALITAGVPVDVEVLRTCIALVDDAVLKQPLLG